MFMPHNFQIDFRKFVSEMIWWESHVSEFELTKVCSSVASNANLFDNLITNAYCRGVSLTFYLIEKEYWFLSLFSKILSQG